MLLPRHLVSFCGCSQQCLAGLQPGIDPHQIGNQSQPLFGISQPDPIITQSRQGSINDRHQLGVAHAVEFLLHAKNTTNRRRHFSNRLLPSTRLLITLFVIHRSSVSIDRRRGMVSTSWKGGRGRSAAEFDR